MNIALIIAGGSGNRMGQDIPKQFINVYDKPVLIYTLEGFQKHPMTLVLHHIFQMQILTPIEAFPYHSFFHAFQG